MSTLKVNAIRQTAASSDAVTLASDGTCTVKATNNLSNRNLIINGAMQVAQRGTSSTTHGYETVDRFTTSVSGADEAPTQAQVDVASGTTPYTLGFKKAFKITNGNQTGGAGAADRVEIICKLEAQDIANSGWNYLSSSSYITLSYWVKSSVAQNFNLFLKTSDGTAKQYPMETGSLSADTWTKITKTIPGDSGLQIDNDNGEGLRIDFPIFYGTDLTNNSASLNAWANYNGAARTPDQTSTWYTTNDATFELTGVQLEVGDVATDFEHRSYADELARCQRYYQFIGKDGTNAAFAAGFTTTSDFYGYGALPGGPMRASPTIAVDGTTSHINYTHTAVGASASSISNQGSGNRSFAIRIQSSTSTTDKSGAYARVDNAATALTFSSEL